MASLLKNILTTQWETHHFVKYSARGIHKWIYVHLNKKESYLELHCFVPSTKKAAYNFCLLFQLRGIFTIMQYPMVSEGETPYNILYWIKLNLLLSRFQLAKRTRQLTCSAFTPGTCMHNSICGCLCTIVKDLIFALIRLDELISFNVNDGKLMMRLDARGDN
jgi:hypothetical protein